jgi:GT2 family glycosyltransferase
VAEKIGALVLTLNRKSTVKECINSLLKQKIDLILVVDNGSSDGTSEMIKKEYSSKRVVLIRNEINLGSAGGYSTGIKEAYNHKIDWLWLFDDDCEALENSLKELKIAKEKLIKQKVDVGFLSSFINNLDEGTFPVDIRYDSEKWAKYYEDSILEVRWNVYTGMLLNMDAVREVGLPIKEFFLYADDDEFTYRITRKYKGFWVGKSHILHKDYFSKRKAYISADSKKIFFKYKYFLRNSIYMARVFLKTKENKKLAFNRFVGVTKNILLPVFFSRNIIQTPSLVWWYFKGLFFNPKIEYLEVN